MGDKKSEPITFIDKESAEKWSEDTGLEVELVFTAYETVVWKSKDTFSGEDWVYFQKLALEKSCRLTSEEFI